MLNDYLETLGTFLSEIKLSLGVRTFMSGRDGCDDSDDDDEPLVDPASTTTGGFADALTDWEPYIPITSTSNGRNAIICEFDLVDLQLAPMCYTSAAIVTHFTAYDVYCVVPLTEGSGIPQALLQNKCRLYLDRVVRAFLDGKTNLMRFWGRNSTVPLNVRQVICDGLCFKKDLPKILKPHLKHHYHAIREQCKAQFATDFIISSCTYDNPPLAFFYEFIKKTRRVMVNIDDQIAAREAMRKAHRDARKLLGEKRLALRNATPSAAEWRRYWGMTDTNSKSPDCLLSLPIATLQCLCDHLDLKSTGLKTKLASKLYRYFQRVDLRSRFPADGGERRPNWRSPDISLDSEESEGEESDDDVPVFQLQARQAVSARPQPDWKVGPPHLKRARLAVDEFIEEYYGHERTVHKWTERLGGQIVVVRERLEWGDDLKQKALEAAEAARVAERAMCSHYVVEEKYMRLAKKRARLLHARELIGQGHFHHDVRPPVRLELPPPRPVPGRLSAFESDLP